MAHPKQRCAVCRRTVIRTEAFAVAGARIHDQVGRGVWVCDEAKCIARASRKKELDRNPLRVRVEKQLFAAFRGALRSGNIVWGRSKISKEGDGTLLCAVNAGARHDSWLVDLTNKGMKAEELPWDASQLGGLAGRPPAAFCLIRRSKHERQLLRGLRQARSLG